MPLIPVIGNHEYYGEGDPGYADADFPELNPNNAEHFKKYFSLPGDRRFFSYNISNAHFVIMDDSIPGASYTTKTTPIGTSVPNGYTTTWLPPTEHTIGYFSMSQNHVLRSIS